MKIKENITKIGIIKKLTIICCLLLLCSCESSSDAKLNKDEFYQYIDDSYIHVDSALGKDGGGQITFITSEKYIDENSLDDYSVAIEGKNIDYDDSDLDQITLLGSPTPTSDQYKPINKNDTVSSAEQKIINDRIKVVKNTKLYYFIINFEPVDNKKDLSIEKINLTKNGDIIFSKKLDKYYLKALAYGSDPKLIKTDGAGGSSWAYINVDPDTGFFQDITFECQKGTRLYNFKDLDVSKGQNYTITVSDAKDQENLKTLKTASYKTAANNFAYTCASDQKLDVQFSKDFTTSANKYTSTTMDFLADGFDIEYNGKSESFIVNWSSNYEPDITIYNYIMNGIK